MQRQQETHSSAPGEIGPRRLALDICLQTGAKGRTLTELLEYYLPRIGNQRDRAFCSELCYGYSRYHRVLQHELGDLLCARAPDAAPRPLRSTGGGV